MTQFLQSDLTSPATSVLRRFPLTGEDVGVGATVIGAAVLLDRQDKLTSAGKPMVMLTMRNATGAASLAVWAEQMPAIAHLNSGSPILLTATWAYGRGGTPEWKFVGAEALPIEHPVLLEAQPVAPVALGVLGARMQALLSVLSTEAQQLFNVVMHTPVAWEPGVLEPMKARFVAAPAATSNHHATRHGLLFHSIQTGELALSLAETFRRTGDARDIDLDAVVLGGVLHDVGKLDELSWQGPFKYTARAAVATHMGWGLCRVTEAVTRAETTTGWRPTARQRELIEHLLMVIASHHAQLSWGALVEPASREAWCVANADQTSAKVQAMTDVAGTGASLAEGWTRVGTGRFGRSQFISPTSSRAEVDARTAGVLRLMLPGAHTEVADVT